MINRLLITCLIICQTAYTSAQTTTLGIQFSDAIIARWPSNINDMTGKGWEYSNSIVLLGMANIYDKTGDAAYLNYIKTYIDGYIGTDGNNVTSALGQNLDKIHPGMLCLWLYEKTGTLKYKTASTKIRDYILQTGASAYPRTPENGFWHKNLTTYTNVMMCDGIYMASPFLAKYGSLFNDNIAIDEAAFQTMLIYSHVYDPSVKLVKHAWCYDKKLNYTWPDATTGVSSQVWSRGMGWYMMALVDILQYLPANHAKQAEMKAALQNLCDGLKTHQDATTGLWFQVVQNPTGASNWIETSGSGMFIYTLKKAINNGWIDGATFTPIVNKAWTGMQTYVKTYSDGKPQITSFAPAMGVLASYSEYTGKTPTSCPGSNHPHGYCSILMASALMEYTWTTTSAISDEFPPCKLYNWGDEINIVLDGLTQNTTINIYNINGSMMSSSSLASNNFHFNTTSFPNGLYFCEIEQNGNRTVGKFIK